MEPSKQLLSEYDYKEKELELILELSKSIVSNLDLEAIMQIISDGMSDLIGTESASLYIIDDKGDFYIGAATPNLPKGLTERDRTRDPDAFPFMKKIIEAQRPQIITDTKLEKLTKQELEVVSSRNLRTIVFLPFMAEGKVIGILALGTIGYVKQHSELELQTAQNVADQLALCLQGAELHRELKKKELLVSNALRITELGYWEYDILNDCFVFSDEMFDMLRTTPEEHGGHRLKPEYYAKKFLFPEDAHLVRETIESFLTFDDPEQVQVFEHRIRYGDGEEGYISVSIKLEIDEEGNIVRAVGTHQNLTHIKQNESRLKEALEKAEESEKLKSAFLANISHEIRTPLNGIMGFASLLGEGDCSPEDTKEYTQLLNQSCKKLLCTVTDIVDISKIEAQQFRTDPHPCRIQELLEGVIRQFEHPASLKGNQIQLIVSETLNDLVVMTDPIRLAQAISNLLDNAIKFTFSGEITLSSQFKANRIYFEVKDNGIGIEPKNQTIIFDRFVQINHGNSYLSSGNGLGLSISKTIVQYLGGELQVASRVGEGSTFFFSIPYQPAKSIDQTIRPESIRALETGPFTVLIAEDEQTNFLYLKQLLKPFHCKVIHARNGQEAVDLHQENDNIDIILMDLKMPVLDGLEATRTIRKTDPTVPIIVQTAYVTDDERKKVMENGGNDFLSKPIDKHLLITTIKHILSKPPTAD